MSTMLEVIDLKKYFNVANGGKLHAVDNVSFKIEKGETLGIVGESGCGKSTLGRTILRLHEPTGGKVVFDGMDVTSFDKEEMRQMRKEMQIIFQDPYASLNPRYTISQIIEEPLKLHNVYKTAEERRKRVEELMDLTGLSMRMYNMYPHEFDGGRRQRVVIARALALNPKFIVCDEPVSALDVSVQAQIINLLMELQEKLGLTYIFISHDMSVIEYISDRIVVMYLGKIMEISDAEELYKKPVHPYTQALLSAIPVADIDHQKERILLEGDVPSPINIPSGCRFHTRCQHCQQICKEQEPELKTYIENGKEHMVACHFSDKAFEK